MNIVRTGSICLVALLAVLFAVPVNPATVGVTGKIVRTLTTDSDRWGGCMVALDTALDGEGLNCPGNWVTFSCGGVHASKEDAARMFESAQMAFFADKTVRIEVTDQKKHNGHCFGRRVDVFK